MMSDIRDEHGSMTRLETDITDNTLEHSVGYRSGLGQQLQKIEHEWLHTGRCRSLKSYLFIFETDQTIIHNRPFLDTRTT
jgi:hypothetical protein